MHEEKSRFLADIAHELQTPIAIVLGNLELVEHGDDSQKERALRVVRTTLSGMSQLVTGMLKPPACHERINVADLIVETHEDCFILATDKNITFTVETKDFFVKGDRRALKEVLLNLISNALKHTESGGVIRLIGQSGRIIVEDTGSGIAPEYLERIFERFYRIKGDETEGAGIGLALCRQMVGAHKGTIGVESELGKGSRFIITLPAAATGL